jgi:hypothetical protein
MPIALKVGPDGSGGQGGVRRMDTVRTTLCWREMDSNYWSR